MTKEATMEATQAVVEEVVDVAEDAAAVVVNNPVVLAAALVAGATAGGFGGYILAKRMLATKYEERLDEEIERTRSFYQQQSVKSEKTPEQLAAEKNLPVDLGYSTAPVVQSESDLVQQTQSMEVAARTRDSVGSSRAEAEVEEVLEEAADEIRSIFDGEIPEWDQTAENAKRNRTTGPYIISKAEYMENDLDHEQVGLVYYEGDEDATLADDRDMPITDIDELVGDDNLNQFGYGSGDRNVLYIRNTSRDMDFEITRSASDYASAVAGFLSHSDDSRMRRRRGFDE